MESARQIAVFEVVGEGAKQVQVLPNPALSAISTSMKGVIAMQKVIELGVDAVIVTRMGGECEKVARGKGVKVMTVKEGTKVSDALRGVH